MKTPLRNFVVERKSGRRRSTMRPASIWGDTDLKALVREAEADAPHLFEPSAVSNTSSQDSEPQPEPTSEARHNYDTETGDQQPILAMPVGAEQNTLSQQGDDPTLNAAAQLKPDTPRPRSPRMVKHRRVATGNPLEEVTSIAPTALPTAAKVEAPADELIVLEEENQRLKGLMAQHLRQQNIQLRKMLARFNVS
jgi:hypothetical protein